MNQVNNTIATLLFITDCESFIQKCTKFLYFSTNSEIAFET